MDTKAKLDELVKANEVVLFMKGTRGAPQCGFSARVVGLLDDYLNEYMTVNVLADPDVREGIKAYSNWPTIPQLYVRGSFVGGCDIVTEMGQSGELAVLLGVEEVEVEEPKVEVSAAAAEAVAQFREDGAPSSLRLTVSRTFEHGLDFDAPGPRDFVIETGGLTLVVDRRSASRAQGVRIDFVETLEGGGFRIDNPNEPPKVRLLTAAELKGWIGGGKPIEIFDVRSESERAEGHIEGSHLLDAAGKARLESLDRDTALVFYCAHGIRSDAAARHAIGMGFKEVHNLEGGIGAYLRS